MNRRLETCATGKHPRSRKKAQKAREFYFTAAERCRIQDTVAHYGDSREEREEREGGLRTRGVKQSADWKSAIQQVGNLRYEQASA